MSLCDTPRHENTRKMSLCSCAGLRSSLFGAAPQSGPDIAPNPTVSPRPGESTRSRWFPEEGSGWWRTFFFRLPQGVGGGWRPPYRGPRQLAPADAPRGNEPVGDGGWEGGAGRQPRGPGSHGGYWKPISNILESRFRVRRVNAHHLRQVPGRPSDVRDGPGIAPLLPQGLWQGSFLPPQREGRDLTRPRTQLVEAKGRTRKEGGRQPPAVARDIWGRARLEALPGGSGPAGGPGAAEAARQNPAAGEGTRRPRTPAF